MCTLSRE